jgi:hypothetical protein
MRFVRVHSCVDEDLIPCDFDLHIRVVCIWFIYSLLPVITGGQDSSVSIATHYGLDGPGIKSRWGRNFPRPSGLAIEPTQPPIQ